MTGKITARKMGKLLKVVSPVKAIMSKSRSTKEMERKKLNYEKEKKSGKRDVEA